MRALIFLLSADNFMLPCLNKQIFGIDCPGCGLQRSVIFLLNGEFGAAFAIYPAIYPLVLLFGFLILDQFLKIKYSNIITIVLMISSVLFILTNYILKFI